LTSPILTSAGPFADQVAKLEDPAHFSKVSSAGEAALPDLLTALNGPRPDLAVQALGQLKLQQAAPAVARLATTDDPELRAAVAWALGECAAADPAPLARLTADPYPPARVAAILSLAKLKSTDFGARLRAALIDPDARVRRAAVDAVRSTADPASAPLLLPMLAYDIARIPDPADKSATPKQIDHVVWKEPAPQVRLAAIQALGQLKSVDTLPALIDCLERAESFHRLAVIQAIRGVGPSAAPVCLGRIVPIPYDKESFDTRMPVLINNGTLAVIAGGLGDTRCVPDLLNTLKLPREKLGRDKDLTALYILTVELLGKFKVDAAARPLAELLKQTRVAQLSAAAQAAVRSIGRAAARPLARNLDAWEVAPIFLALLREPEMKTVAAREGIIRFLSHESDEVRLEATKALGQYLFDGILDEYDVPLLDAMYLDANREIRVTCALWQQRIAKKQGTEVSR
jgi:HEAT repeat protein